MTRGISSSQRGRGLARLFGVESLATFALAGFSVLSAVATAMGFADLRAANTGTGELGAADLAAAFALAAFVVASMVVALHAMLDARRGLLVRLVSGLFYLFFAIWSVGFGYGFFWKELAGQEFTRQQFEQALVDASSSAARASETVASAVQETESVAALAASRAEIEARDGGTCSNQPYSTTGDGPLTRSRFVFADGAKALADSVRVQWLTPVQTQRERLDRELSAIRTGSVPPADGLPAAERARLQRLAAANTLPAPERRVLFEETFASARSTIEASNALRARIAPPLSERLLFMARSVGGDPAAPGQPDPARANDPAYCRDAVLEERLNAAARQIAALGDAPAPAFEFIEGPKATRAAFFGLMEQLGRLVGLRMEPAGGFEFGSRAYLALFASIAVDLGIVFLTILRSARLNERKRRPAEGDGQPEPPVLSTILE